jgi:2-furoate---CoA ligase
VEKTLSKDGSRAMFDLGRTFLAAVERSPDALAIVDGERRPSQAAWYSNLDPGMLSIRLRGAGDAA